MSQMNHRGFKDYDAKLAPGGSFGAPPPADDAGDADDLEAQIRKARERVNLFTDQHFTPEEFARHMALWGPVIKQPIDDHRMHTKHGIRAVSHNDEKFDVCKTHVSIGDSLDDKKMHALMLHAKAEFGGKLSPMDDISKYKPEQLLKVWTYCQAYGVEFSGWAPTEVTAEMQSTIEALRKAEAARAKAAPTPEEARTQTKAAPKQPSWGNDDPLGPVIEQSKDSEEQILGNKWADHVSDKREQAKETHTPTEPKAADSTHPIIYAEFEEKTPPSSEVLALPAPETMAQAAPGEKPTPKALEGPVQAIKGPRPAKRLTGGPGGLSR